jgi:cardiolipin synthase
MSMSDSTRSWRFYLSPAAAWDAMYRDCENATEIIQLEQYIFENDPVGQKFLRLFIQKAKQGVKIGILCDMVGSFGLSGSPLVTELRQSGGTFRSYNAFTLIDLLRMRRWVPRTHVKMLAADQAAYIGGVCLAERMKDWRDTQMCVTGPVVAQIRRALERNMKGRVVFRQPPPPVDSEFTYVQSEPWLFQHRIYKMLLKAIRRASDTIYISAAFFVPTRRFRRLLRVAAFKGVKVIVLVPEHSDFWLADWVCLSYAAKLLKAGVRIFRYRPTVLHNKTVVIDDAWATVGSSNMDALSFFRNRESNLIITNKDAIAEMKKDFLNDLQQSEELTLAILEQIPLWKRIAAHAGRLFRSFL